MKRLDVAEREELVGLVRQDMLREHKPHELPQLCIYWANALVQRLRERGVRAVLQAGTMSWPRIPIEQDDGVSPTHFSFEWDFRRVMTFLGLGVLPELHTWVAIPATQEILDLTTGYFPELCESMARMPWLGPKPPPFLWATAEEFPERVIYRPEPLAIALVLQILQS